VVEPSVIVTTRIKEEVAEKKPFPPAPPPPPVFWSVSQPNNPLPALYTTLLALPLQVASPSWRKAEERLVVAETLNVLDAARLPDTMSPAPTELEALEINPPCKVASPVVKKVEDTVVAPETLKVPPMLEEV